MTGGDGNRRTERRAWTVLLIDDVGKIVSFSVSKPLLLISIVSLVLVSTVSIYFLFSYHRLRTEREGLRQALDRVRADLDVAEKSREKVLLRLMMREESPDQALRGSGSEQEQETIVSESGQRVTAKDLEVWQETDEGTGFRFQFIVQRVRPGEGKVSGYTFIVLRPGEGSAESPRVIPATTLKAGKPGVFSEGQYFSIARYKFVRGTFPGLTRMDPFKTATLFVYSDRGELLAEKTFKLGEILRS